MGQRCYEHDYSQAGLYHITMTVAEKEAQPLGCVKGNATAAPGEADTPHVALSPIGKMVEEELTRSLPRHYPMIEVQDYVVMPEHIHFIIEVHGSLKSANGRSTHLGQVMAGFKKGCNRRFWAITGQEAAGAAERQRGKPAAANANKEDPPTSAGAAQGASAGAAQEASAGAAQGASTGAAQEASAGAAQGASTGAGGSWCPAVSPQERWKVPSRAGTGRPPLFAPGYVDVIPLHKGQLQTQREYIRNNPRNRLLRQQQRLFTERLSVTTALTVPALRRYLVQERAFPHFEEEPSWQALAPRLLTATADSRKATATPQAVPFIALDTYGNRRLLERRLLPVVCHRKDQEQFEKQRRRCIEAATTGAVLVSARIAKEEQAIMDEAMKAGATVILIHDNGFPERYHPSMERLQLCAEGRLLIVTPWCYHYRPQKEGISQPECKTMNCVAQALCRLKDSWWKEE